MIPCIFLANENAQGCLAERERRFREHRPDIRPWEKNPCENCKTGRKRAEAHIPPEPDEEESMPEKMTTKEKVLAAIERRKSASPTILMQTCKASADQLRGIVAALEQEGKITPWPYRGRAGMTAIYTLPDAKDNRTEEMVAGEISKPEKKAPPTEQEKVRKAAIGAPRVINRSPVNGGNPFAAVIADLEARKKKIDIAIETLRALA